MCDLADICTTLMCDAKVKHKWHRPRNSCEVSDKLDVSASLTPALSHLLSLYLMCCAKQVSKLLNCPVTGLHVLT